MITSEKHQPVYVASELDLKNGKGSRKPQRPSPVRGHGNELEFGEGF